MQDARHVAVAPRLQRGFGVAHGRHALVQRVFHHAPQHAAPFRIAAHHAHQRRHGKYFLIGNRHRLGRLHWRALGQVAQDDCHHLFHHHGLGDEIADAGRHAALAFGRQHAGRHGDHGQVQAQFRADDMGGAEAVHDGHLHVHQHDVVAQRFRAQPLHRLQAVAHHVQGGAHVFEDAARHGLVQMIVFHQQEMHACQFRAQWLVQDALFTAVVLGDQRLVQGIEQARTRDRLHQHDIGLGRAGDFFQVVAGEGVDHHHDGLALAAGRLADGLGRGQAVHDGHVPVGQHHVVRLLLRQAFAVQFDGGKAGVHFVGQPAPGLDQLDDQFARGAVIVGHQQAQLAQGRRAPRFGRLRQHLERHAEPEAAALAFAAGHGDITAHHVDQLLADGQAQARAAEAPRDALVAL